MSEPPFRPREKLIQKQKYFHNIHKHTYLKGPYDKITSVAIPLALAATSLYLIVSNLFVNHFPENFIYIICIDSVRLNIWMSLLIYGAIHFKHWFTSLICSGKRDLQYVTRNREERMTCKVFCGTSWDWVTADFLCLHMFGALISFLVLKTFITHGFKSGNE